MNAQDRSRWLEPSPPLPVDDDELSPTPPEPTPRADPGPRELEDDTPRQPPGEHTAG